MLFLITKGSEAMEKILGTSAGILTGIIAGWLIANYIIFPILLGDTLIEVLQAL